MVGSVTNAFYMKEWLDVYWLFVCQESRSKLLDSVGIQNLEMAGKNAEY